eukprot:11221673-Lingulodinium_polyedra.AAC.1
MAILGAAIVLAETRGNRTPRYDAVALALISPSICSHKKNAATPRAARPPCGRCSLPARNTPS